MGRPDPIDGRHVGELRVRYATAHIPLHAELEAGMAGRLRVHRAIGLALLANILTLLAGIRKKQ